MNESKVKTYLGFAVKAGKIVWGADNILARKRFYPLIVVSNTASVRLKRDIEEYAADKIPVIEVEDLSALISKENCKAVAVTEKNLAKAILENSGQKAEDVSEGRRVED